MITEWYMLFMHCIVCHCMSCDSRVIKTEEELEVLRYVNQISSKAHCEVRKCRSRGRGVINQLSPICLVYVSVL